jgi:PAS domain S-box-containing protein
MEVQLQGSADEIKQLQRCINDLVSVLPLPAVWTGGESPQIISTLMDAVLRMLTLDLIYVWSKESAGETPIEMARVAPTWGPMPEAREIGKMLHQLLGDNPQVWPPVVQIPFGEVDISIVSLALGPHADAGVIVAGSRRADFPRETERLVLSVVANQAAIGLREAWLLGEQKRLASEIDQQVAQRTVELAKANQALREEIAERQRASEALQMRELNLRLLVDSIPAPVAVMTPAGEVESVNQPVLEYFGKTFEELKRWGTGDAVHSDDLPQAIAVWREAIETGHPYDVKERLRRFDGVYRWFGVRGFPLRDPDGRILNWCVLLSDIDDRERAEEVLRASERNLGLNINAMPMLLASARPDGWGDFFNQRWLDYTGLSAKQLEGWGWATPLHPDDAEGLLKIWRASLVSGAPLEAEARMRRFDGTYRWLLFRANALRDESGTILKWYGTAADIEERKRAEAKLRRSEADLLEAQRLTHTGSWKHDTSSGNVTVSPEIHRIFGSSPDEDTSNPEFWFGRIHPDDRQRIQELFQKSEIEKTNYEADYRLLLPDGEVRHQHAVGRPVLNESGDIVEFVGTAMDVTEQVQARIALQKAFDAIEKSEDQLRATISAIPTLAWSTDPDGSADFFNQRWLDYTGLPAEKAKGWGWRASIHPDDVKRLVDSWKSSLASGSATAAGAEARMRRFDGTYRWFLFRANPLRDESGGIVKWYGTSTDIDDRKRAEEQLRRSEAFLAEGQRLSSTGSFSFRVATDEVVFSEEMCRIFELEPPVSLRMLASRIHPEDLPVFKGNLEQARRGDPNDMRNDLRLLLPNGSVKCIQIVAHSNRDDGGQLEYIGTAQDVTQRRLFEEALSKARSELARAASIASLAGLTASIAHEVNQPLSGVVTNASTCLLMLDSDPPNVDVARETARRALRDGNRASEIITRLRALFSKKQVTTESVDLNETTREVIAVSLSELQRNRVLLRTEFDSDLPLVTGDRVQLQQVILNLLRNASDAMSAVQDRPRHLLIRTELEECDRVRLTVQDVGVGFDSGAMDKLFQAFYTTKTEGMGMGLSISRSIIENHYGRLWATPNDGPGATFCFSLPRQREGGTVARGGAV